LNAFPAILEHRQDFLLRVIQFTGLGLIHQLQETIKYQQQFSYTDMYTLQLAHNLLIMPEKSVQTIFGVTEPEIFAPLTEPYQLHQPQKKQNLVRLYYEKTRLRGC
jgi:hypothetical protein